MKKISKELRKSYIILIFLFLLSYFGIILFFAYYVNNVTYADLKTTDGFMKYELGEFDHKLKLGKSVEELFQGALDECPKIDGLSALFIYNNKIYGEEYPKDAIEKIEKGFKSEEVQKLGFYRYQFIYREIKVNDDISFDLILVKNMKEDRHMLQGILRIVAILAVFTLLITIYISKAFYQKFMNPLKTLQDITNNLNLNTLNNEIKTSNQFIEFSNIITAYENMLKRLKTQTDSQIEFVNNASHELKTPIFIINGYINLIKRWGHENQEITQEAIDSIEEETKNMSTLVSKLLFLAKDNISDIEHREFDLKALIENIINDLKIVYPSEKISLFGEEVSIISDYNLIKQLLVNLIENSIKYGRRNDIDIKIIKGQNIMIEIKDRGEGISKENLEHIYDKFFRVDKARSREINSHGLGLSIVRKITDALNIDINIESELNVGTIVTLTLPKL